MSEIPYIRQTAREEIEAGRDPETVGELTYVLTVLVDRYVGRDEVSFSRLGEAMLALEATKLEFYRRVGAPYEDQRMIENGEVYSVAVDED